MNMLSHIALLLVLPWLAGPAHAQSTWYVDDDCAPPGAGTEGDPFCTIQHGIDTASDGDEVFVYPGAYTGDGNRDISLFGKTIMLRSIEGPYATVIDIDGNPQSIHRGFLLIHGETADTIIEGFTIIDGYLIGDTGGIGTGTPGGGGAAVMIRDSSPTIRGCLMVNNTSADDGNPFIADGLGGGVYVDGGSSAIIENCIIANNVSENRGGGLYIGFEASAVSIRNCLISGNSASNGGGIYTTFGKTTVIGTAIVDNTTVFGGGGVASEQGEPVLRNCILWSNVAGSVGSQIIISGPVLTIEYSNVQGGLEDVYGCCNWKINWGPGMIDADPLFVDAENGDFRFLHGSPCIDAGDNLAVPEGVVTDLDGGPRFLDDPDTRDTGNPDPEAPELPIVDMGPYEFDPDDCNNNDTPDTEDLANGTSEDCNANEIPDDCELDCNANDQQDDCDIADGVSNDCDDNGIPDECEDAPGPIIIADPVSQEVGPGDFVLFSVEADGILLEYQWRKDGVELGDTERILGTNTSGLFIFEVMPSDAGSYDCVVTDFFGACATTNAAELTVTAPCPADFDDSGAVGAFDLGILLGAWGPNPNHPADLNNDDAVGAPDLALLLGAWGPCK